MKHLNLQRKFIHSPIKLVLLLLLVILIASCEKEDSYGFGETVEGFIPDSIYKAATDGFLYVEFVDINEYYSLGRATSEVYCSDNPESLELIGSVVSTSTIPIKQNKYWMVENLTKNDLIIRWTPID